MKTTRNKTNVTKASPDALVATARMMDLVRSVECLSVTSDELAAFDDSSFDAQHAESESSIADPAEFLRKLDRIVDEETSREPQAQVEILQTELFSGDAVADRRGSPQGYDFTVSRQRFTSLVTLAIQAFADVRDGWSADYVILDPDRNLEFLKRCWQLGAAATPEELNWTLMNARKDGRLAGLGAANRFSLPKRELDGFAFAAEMALRELQDRAWVEEQRSDLSLDKLLCSPRLSGEFDRLAQSVRPGFSPLKYRWAALALRKARRIAKKALPMPLFDERGALKDVRRSQLSTEAGIFWVRFEDRSAYVGVAENLQTQVDSFIGSLGDTATPSWLKDRPQGHASLSLLSMADANWDDRELLRSSIFRRCGSRMNFKDASLFSAMSVA